MSETLEFGSGLAEPGLSNKVTFLLYFTPKWSSWAQSDPILHHLKQSMGAGIVFSSWGEVQTCLQTGNLKNFGLKRIFRPKPLCTVCYPEEKIPTSIFILLNILSHLYLKTLCITIESSHFTILSLNHQPT